MSIHSRTRLIIHLIWSTYKRKAIVEGALRKRLHKFLHEYSERKEFGYITSYVNADHVHYMVDISPTKSISDLVKQIKGASSRWLNQQDDQWSKFNWGRGYAAFSVSESKVKQVIDYINNQKVHHAKHSFQEEIDLFQKKYRIEN